MTQLSYFIPGTTTVICPHCGYEFDPDADPFIRVLRKLQRNDIDGIRTAAVAAQLGIGHATAWRKLKHLEKAGIIKRPDNCPKSPYKLAV